MTRTYALKRLLEHGALTYTEILEVTRWEKKSAKDAIKKLLKCGLVKRTTVHGCARFCYELT